MILKVCHVTNIHPRYDARILKKECVSLAKAGYDVTLIVADNKPDEVVDNVKISSITCCNRGRINRIFSQQSILLERILSEDADIYHLHDPELLLLGNRLKSHGRIVIYDSHEDHPMQIKTKHYIRPAFMRNVISVLFRRYETFVAKRVDAVIIPCTLNGGCNIFSGRSKRTVYISNAPLISDFYNKYDPGKRGYAGRAACYTGALTETRGITHLIKAAYRADVKLILAGLFSPPEYQQEVRRMSEYSCVDYRGMLPINEVAELYNSVNIGMATILNRGQYNTGDSFATKVYEYMSMGIPVILSRSPYADNILKKYRFGLTVDPEDINAIAGAMNYIIENPDIAREMGENGRRAVFEEFNWGVEEKKLLELYDSLCSG